MGATRFREFKPRHRNYVVWKDDYFKMASAPAGKLQYEAHPVSIMPPLSFDSFRISREKKGILQKRNQTIFFISNSIFYVVFIFMSTS